MLKVTTKEGGVRFEVHAKPRAKASAVRGVREGALEVSLAAPPVDGAANDELVRVLSRALDVPKSHVTIVRGEGSRTKLVSVAGITVSELTTRLGL